MYEGVFGYFFGVGTGPEFVNFMLPHFAPILLAYVMIFSEMSYYWRLVGVLPLEPNPVDRLPITVCGWAAVFCSYMMIGKAQTLFDISYFWLLSGSIFALITPTVITYTDMTRFRCYQFWIEHTIGYIGIFYMIFVYKMRPTIKSAIKSYVALIVLAAVITALFGLACLPWFLKDRKAMRQAA